MDCWGCAIPGYAANHRARHGVTAQHLPTSTLVSDSSIRTHVAHLFVNQRNSPAYLPTPEMAPSYARSVRANLSNVLAKAVR